ncbi:TIR domain-containing protein [Bacillus badius]|uniref:TIR domain-containing protein n=1 Tax=Bacillus badius TaxID=1455 RepID=UPI002E22B344|nr:TIR domain-containing protein [Bacillus badius]MED0667740.1 TIR domain-containing protein [Bacillus badius]
MAEELKADKVFISYAWSNPEHEKWVLELAERLEGNGVEVIIDKWDSTEGQNLNAFMQRSVNDPTITKVLVICDETYAKKADGFEGGVGTETVIISNEVYQDVKQTKFIPIISERSDEGEAYIPTYLKGTKYIDMSSEQSYEDGYEKLLRNLYGKPEYVRPTRGKAPSFLLQDEKKTVLGSRRALSRFRHNVEKRPRNIDIYYREFSQTFKEDFASYAINVSNSNELLNSIYSSLHQSMELRDVYIEFMEFYIKESETVDVHLIIDFFESLYPIIYTKQNASSYYESQFDHMKLFVTELMIYTVSLLYKYRKYTVIKDLVNNHYFVMGDNGRELDGPIGLFNRYPKLIEEARIPSTGQKYISNSGQLILDRANYNGITSADLVEADFLLYFLSYSFDKFNDYFSWNPPTSPYFTNQRISFMTKLKSKRFFESVKVMFGISEVEEMKKLVEGFKVYLDQHMASRNSLMFIKNTIIKPEDIASL